MAEADISKIVSLIMENPKLIEEIKGLAEEKKDSAEMAAKPEDNNVIEKDAGTATYAPETNTVKIKRRDLLSALKPYVSEERGRAIDSMLSISDILDMVKTR